MDKETIFAEALTKQTPEERRRLLESACAGNHELRKEIEALLAAHEDAGSFLNKTPEEFILTADTDDATNDETDWDEDAWRELLEPSDNPDYLGKLGPYEVIEVLGRGGFGIVLRATDSKLHRAVAIKLLAPQLTLTGSAVQRFLREARATAAVSHNHVVSIHSIDDSSRPPMIVMEYVEGQSLQQKIDNTGALDVKSILRIGMQTASGLAAAHQQGLVHRDIKPANILLENGIERVKLTDFGLARAVDEIGITRTGQITGTPQYMSPEQAQGQRVDHRTDLFSLGCVMYAMCTGRAAFRADSAMAVMNRVVNDSPRLIREINEDIPIWLCEIVDKLLAKKPEDRFQTAEEVAKLLGDHLAHLQQPDSVPQPAPIGFSSASELLQNTTVLDEYDRQHAARTDLSETSISDPETDQVLTMVKGPATGLIVTAVANWIGIPVVIYLIFLKPLLEKMDGGGLVIDPLPMTVMLTLIGIITMLVTGFMIFGALKMKRLEGYWLAVVGSVLAMIVTPGNLIGLPIGVWSLFVLTRRDVRVAFRRHRFPTESQLPKEKRASSSGDPDPTVQLDVDQAVLQELEKGMVPAIRAYRKQTGAGLADARNAVERIAREHDIPIPSMTSQQRIKQTALTTVTVAVLAWAAATAIEKGVFTFLVTPAFTVVVAVYLMFLIAMWRGSRMDREQQKLVVEASDRLEAQRQATQVLTLLGILDVLLIPALFLWLAGTLTYSKILAGVLSFSCVLISPVFGILILMVTLIGHRFHVAKGTLDRETGLFASLLALLPAGPLHLLALPATIWAFRTFKRADRSRPASSSWPLIYVGAASVLLVVLAGIELQTGKFSQQWLTLEGRGRISVELQYTQTEVTLTGTSEASDGSLVRYRSYAMLQVDEGSYHAEWRDADGNQIGSRAIRVFPGSKTTLLIPNSAESVDIRGPLSPGQAPTFMPTPAKQNSVELAMTWGQQGDDPILDIDVSPNGQWLASAHMGGKMILWDTSRQGESRRSFSDPDFASNVIKVAFSPDSQFIAWVSSSGRLRICDTSNTQNSQIDHFARIEGALASLAWARDGKTIATGANGKFLIWDVTRGGQPVSEIRVPSKGMVFCMTYTPDGSQLVTGDSTGHIFVWDTRQTTPAVLHELKGVHNKVPVHSRAVRSLSFSPEGDTVISAGEDGEIYSWDFKNPSWPQNKTNRGPAIFASAFSPDGKILAWGGASRGLIRLFDFDTLSPHPLDKALAALGEHHTDDIRSINFTPDGKYLISGSEDGTIKWWKFAKPLATPAAAGNNEQPLQVEYSRTWWADDSPGTPVLAVDMSKDDKWVVSGHRGTQNQDGQVRLCRVREAGEIVMGPSVPAGVHVWDVAFNPDGTLFAWVQEDGILGVAPANSFTHEQAVRSAPYGRPLRCVTWSDDGQTILTGGGPFLQFWDVPEIGENAPGISKPRFETVTQAGTIVTDLAYSPDGSQIAAACDDGQIIVFRTDRTPPTHLKLLKHDNGSKPHTGPVHSLAYTPDGSLLLSVGADGRVCGWDVAEGRGTFQSFRTGGRARNAVAVSHNGSHFADAGDELMIGIRALDQPAQTRARLPRIEDQHTDDITSLVFTHDGKYLLSGSEDGTIKWWEFAKPLVKEIEVPPVINVREKPELPDESNNGGHSNFWRTLVSEGSMVPKVRWANRHVKAELTGGHAGLDSSGSSEFINEQTGESTFQFRGTQQQLTEFFTYYKAELRQIASENGASLQNAWWSEKGTEFHLQYVTPLAQGKGGAKLEEIEKDPDDETILSGLLTVFIEESFRSPKAGGDPKAELPEMEDPAPNVLSWKQERTGWRNLFDGKTLDGWNVESGTWKVADDWIVGEPNGVMHSHSLFDGIELSYEWKTQQYGSLNRGRLIRQGEQIIHQVNGQTVPAEKLEHQFLLLQDGIKLRTGEERVWFRNLRIQSSPPLQPVLDQKILPTAAWYDLFDRLDPIRHAKNQWWQPADEGYELTGDSFLSGGGLLVPRERIDPWADYELETTLTPAGRGGTQVFITFPVGSTTCSLFADKSFANRIGLHHIDGISAARPENPSSHHPSPFQNDVKQTFTITVRSTDNEAHITVKLDGNEVVDWRSDFDRINTDSHWRPDEPWSFGFGGFVAHDGSLTYHSARLRPLEEVAGETKE